MTERGFSFGYNNLVVDMRAFPMMRGLGAPVVFDVTHSLQLPGGGDGVTAGLAEYIEPLASAGVGAGVDGVFLEVHEEPVAREERRAERAARSRGSRRCSNASSAINADRQGTGRSHQIAASHDQPEAQSQAERVGSTWRAASSRPRRRRFSA